MLKTTPPTASAIILSAGVLVVALALAGYIDLTSIDPFSMLVAVSARVDQAALKD